MAAQMPVILTRDVHKLGHIGHVVKVRPGYARNYLYPMGLALPASVERANQFEHQKRVIERQKSKIRVASEQLRDRLANLQITIESKTGDQGKLFGSVGTRDIEQALIPMGFTIHHRDIHLEKPIKTVGLHAVPVRLEGDVKGTLQVVVVPQAEQAPALAETKEDA